MNEQDIIPVFQEAAVEVVGHPIEQLTLDTELSDLSLDSVAVMEIVGFVEQKLGVRFNDEDLSRLTTVRDLSALVRKIRNGA